MKNLMIHFDFTVSPVDAETIMGAMSHAIVECDEQVLERMTPKQTKRQKSEIDWLVRHKAYLIDLKAKMKNTIVGTP